LTPEFNLELSFSEAVANYPNPNDLYRYMHHYFHQRAPACLREHRAYFSTAGRGFGEDAMHAMWWLLLLESTRLNCIEIGVFRGQVISLWALIARYLHRDISVAGVSPLTAAGDTVTRYTESVDYATDIAANFQNFQLPAPQLCKALSTDPKAHSFLRSRKWDLIYIDGSHDYDIALQDYNLCRSALADDGLLVFDDAAAMTDFKPPSFSFAGHPGPSRLIAEIVAKEMRLVAGVGHNMIFGHRN
jgi:hypothetical protein